MVKAFGENFIGLNPQKFSPVNLMTVCIVLIVSDRLDCSYSLAAFPF